MDSLLKIYENNLIGIKEREVVKGVILSINDRDVIIDIGFKSDGLISVSEFKDFPNLKIGDEVEVYIEKQEDEKGQLILSRKKAKLVKG
jgi:small subunit ribosomal protein S1